MKAIVCGGRDYSDLEHAYRTLDSCKKWWNLTTIIHGYAGPIIGEWEQVSVNTFDDVEQYVVMDENENTLYEEDR